MTCTQANEAISALLDHELDAAQEAEVREHASGCPECGATLRSLSRLEELTSQAFAPEPVDDLTWARTWQSIESGVRRQGQKARSLSRAGTIGWATAAAAVVVTVVGLSLLWRSPAPEAPDRLALLETGGVRMELVNGGGEDYIPFVMMTEDEVPVVYVIEAGE
jgi:anti-sigma factor RsiW